MSSNSKGAVGRAYLDETLVDELSSVEANVFHRQRCYCDSQKHLDRTCGVRFDHYGRNDVYAANHAKKGQDHE